METEKLANSSERTSSESSGRIATNADLIIVLIITGVVTLAIYVPYLNTSVLRFIFGYAIIFFIPGYALLAALFPRKTDINNLERIVFSTCLSLLAVALVGFFLNYTEWGVRLGPVAASLVGLIVVCVATGYVRRMQLSPPDRFSVRLNRRAVAESFGAAHFTSKRDERVNRWLTVALAAVVIVSTLSLTYIFAAPKEGERYTEFYILDSKGKAENYPSQLRLNIAAPVIIGVANNGQQDVQYDLRVQLSNGSQQSILYSQRLALANDQKWEQLIELKPDRVGNDMKLEFLLYRPSETVPYKELHLWVDVLPAS